MRFVMRQKILTLRDSFDITDENDELAFTAKSKFFSFRKSFALKDKFEQDFVTIKQQLFAIKPKFVFENHQGEKALLKKHFFPLFRHNFSLYIGAEKVTIQGNFWAHEYQFEHQGKVTAQVSKKWFSWSDTYGVDVMNASQVWFVLSTVIAIDCILHDDRNSNVDIG